MSRKLRLHVFQVQATQPVKIRGIASCCNVLWIPSKVLSGKRKRIPLVVTVQ